jgi:carboxylesterase
MGCLLIHGFTSAPQEMRGLGEHLAGRGHSVLGLRLPGHATRPAAMTTTRWQDWLAALEDGCSLLQAMADQVVAIGLSLGGVLSMLLSSTKPLVGVVAMGTPFDVPPQPRIRFLRLLLPPLRLLSPILRYIPKPPPRDYKDREAAKAHLSYPIFPVRGIIEIDRLLRVFSGLLPKMTLPVLMLHAREDGGVSPENAKAIFARLGSQEKDLIWIEGSGHVVTVEPAREQVFALTAEFVEKVGAN